MCFPLSCHLFSAELNRNLIFYFSIKSAWGWLTDSKVTREGQLTESVVTEILYSREKKKKKRYMENQLKEAILVAIDSFCTVFNK